ncbi:hypothetical protein D3C72_641260 [compost metagenome]
MPVSPIRPTQTPPPGGPGKWAVTQTDPNRATMTYTLGDNQPDRTWNGDGLHLSAEAQVRAGQHGEAEMERLRVRAGIEGIEAKIGLVKDGVAKPRFEGLSLKDGALKQNVRDAGEYLKDHPAAAAGVLVGTVVIAHEVAKATGDDIKVDTGKIKLYQQDGFTASVVGEVAITGDSAWIRGQGAKLRMGYQTPDVGDLSVEAGYDRDARTKVTANWSKTYDSGLRATAGAFYEERNKNYGVNVGLSYRF